MRHVLTDLHKTDAMIQLSGLSYKDNEIKDIYYAETLERHGVTQAQFDSSLVWYTAHPLFFNKIYPKVLRDLETEESAYLALHSESGLEEEGVSGLAVSGLVDKWYLDSVLWVTQHGYPNSWNPLVHDFKDELFPQIDVLCGGVVDTLDTCVSVTEIAHD